MEKKKSEKKELKGDDEETPHCYKCGKEGYTLYTCPVCSLAVAKKKYEDKKKILH